MVISMVGFCSGSALVGPQLVASLARDGVLPSVVARVHPTRGTPNVAIAVVTLSTMLAVAVLGTRELANLTIVTLFAQYAPTCMAVIVFRRWRADAPRRFRVPLGATIPLVALLVMAVLITRIDRKALAVTGVILAVGIVVVLVTRAVEKRPRAFGAPKDPTAG
jgi:amino acid transporter